MSDYFVDTLAVTYPSPSKVVDSADVDRLVTGGPVSSSQSPNDHNFLIGFSSSTAVWPSASSNVSSGFVLPAGEELWAVGNQNALSWTVMVTSAVKQLGIGITTC